MNSLICFLTVFHLFKLARRRLFVSKITRRLVYLGIFLPLGDYLLRMVRGDLWFFSGNLFFHSVPCHFLFWVVIALLFWVYSRDVLSSLRFLAPLLGLLCYMVFCLFSTEYLTFWAPVSEHGIRLNWVNSGYLIPSTVALLLQLSKRWSELSSVTVGRISIGVLVVFVSLAGFFRHNAISAIPEPHDSSGVQSVYPANILQTEWNTVVFHEGIYFSSRYHFVQGYQESFTSVEAFDDFETAQGVLVDQSIRRLYRFGFKNPVVSIQIQKEALQIAIKELYPAPELLWIQHAQIVRNRSGLILDYNSQYGTFF